MKMSKRMHGMVITHERNVFYVLIKYFCEEKICMLAYQALEVMHMNGHQPETVFYSLHKFNFHITSITYLSLLFACA